MDRPFKEDALSVEYLRECFEYDAVHGYLLWKARPLTHFRNQKVMQAWNAKHRGLKAGSMKDIGKIEVSLNGDLYSAHRLIWKLVTGKSATKRIRHRDGDNSFNRLANLEEYDGTRY